MPVEVCDPLKGVFNCQLSKIVVLSKEDKQVLKVTVFKAWSQMFTKPKFPVFSHDLWMLVSDIWQIFILGNSGNGIFSSDRKILELCFKGK